MAWVENGGIRMWEPDPREEQVRAIRGWFSPGVVVEEGAVFHHTHWVVEAFPERFAPLEPEPEPEAELEPEPEPDEELEPVADAAAPADEPGWKIGRWRLVP